MKKLQMTLTFWDIDKYINAGVTMYSAQASNNFSKVLAMFMENHLKFSSSTNIEVRGQTEQEERILYSGHFFKHCRCQNFQESSS